MQYVDIFSVPDLLPVGFSILQSSFIFWLIILGLQIVGQRVFAQRGPQDLVVIVLVAEACDLGLTHEDAGFWGTVASVVTLLLWGYLVEKIGFIRRLLNRKPIVLYENGKLHKPLMRKHMVDEEDLNEVAREEGRASYTEFKAMLLEGDGQISALRFDKDN